MNQLAINFNFPAHTLCRAGDPSTSREAASRVREWRQIPGFSRYSASNDGMVRRDVRVGNFMPSMSSISINADGYPQVSITDDFGRYKKENVHSLVAAAFLGTRPDGLVVCHTDGNPRNCHISNLRYDTYTGNVHDAIRHGTQVKGERVVQHRIKEKDVVEIVKMLDAGAVNYKNIAMQFGATKYIVFAIASGWTWKHITGGKNRRTGFWHNNPVTRIQKAGKAKPNGMTAPTISGRSQRVWIAI